MRPLGPVDGGKGGSWRRRREQRSSPTAIRGRQVEEQVGRKTNPMPEAHQSRACTRRSDKTIRASRLAAEGSFQWTPRPLESLHSRCGGKSVEVHLSLAEAAIDARPGAGAAIYVSKNCNEVTSLKGTGYVGASCLHGCFLAAEAIEAATSLAILICASRSRS